jgi:hypothetical protein
MEVLEGLPREYVVRLRERVLVDVFWFFRDNNIANSPTLLNALQKYVFPFAFLLFAFLFVSFRLVHFIKHKGHHFHLLIAVSLVVSLVVCVCRLCVLALHAWLWRDSIVLLECRKVPASSKYVT